MGSVPPCADHGVQEQRQTQQGVNQVWDPSGEPSQELTEMEPEKGVETRPRMHPWYRKKGDKGSAGGEFQGTHKEFSQEKDACSMGWMPMKEPVAKFQRWNKNIGKSKHGLTRPSLKLFESVSGPMVQGMDPGRAGQSHWVLLSLHYWTVSVRLGTRQPTLLLCWIKKKCLNKWNYHLLQKLKFLKKLILNA